MNEKITFVTESELPVTQCVELKFKGYYLRVTEKDFNWIAEDVCLALRLSKNTWNKIPLEYRNLVQVLVGRGQQGLLFPNEVQTLNEDGLKHLIGFASKQTALQFMEWYYEEAVPYLNWMA
ncbi:MAG: hypothetical protein SAJ37_22095 [Oscillatoria sp. PMC 1068.18]|nr:hypothetical protein [Oscillatoria sp. PMC 1076.18]MEC4991435.1 hypothetical protein [Oscillatoria sp. PMC 1068.18]